MKIRAPPSPRGGSLTFAAPALAAIEDGYDPNGAPVPTAWCEPASPASIKAGRDYVAWMCPHHAGALSMSEAYLPARRPAARC